MQDTPNDTQGRYSIVACQAPIEMAQTIPVGKALSPGHLYLQIRDEQENTVIMQVDGLPQKPDGSYAMVGTARDTLQAVITDEQRWGNAAHHKEHVIYATDDKAHINDITTQIETMASEINSQQLRYTMIPTQSGHANSNTVFNTIITDLQASQTAEITPENMDNARKLGGVNPGAHRTIDLSQQPQQSDKAVLGEYTSRVLEQQSNQLSLSSRTP